MSVFPLSLGATPSVGTKLALTALVSAAIVGVRLLVVVGVWRATQVRPNNRFLFWTRQGTSLAALVVLGVVFASIKDQINRTILREFDAAGLEIASATVDISSVPPLRLAPAEGVNPWPNDQ